jgi:PhnB protein
MVKPIPDGYSSITPYLIFENANSAIDFYGNSRIMLADENPQMDAYGPKHHNGSPVSLMLYVDDVDSFTKNAVATGLKVLRPVINQFYGDRSGTFLDPFGYKWTIGTHVEDVSPEEMETRVASLTAG